MNFCPSRFAIYSTLHGVSSDNRAPRKVTLEAVATLCPSPVPLTQCTHAHTGT